MVGERRIALRLDLGYGRKRSRGAQSPLGGHGTGADRFGQHFESEARHGRNHYRRAQLSASYPFLTSFRDSVAARKRNVQRLLAGRLGKAGECFPCAHRHGIVLADNGPNVKLTGRAQR